MTPTLSPQIARTQLDEAAPHRAELRRPRGAPDHRRVGAAAALSRAPAGGDGRMGLTAPLSLARSAARTRQARPAPDRRGAGPGSAGSPPPAWCRSDPAPFTVHGDPAERERYWFPDCAGEIGCASPSPSRVTGPTSPASRRPRCATPRAAADAARCSSPTSPFVELFLVAAKISPADARRGISLFAVERGTAGLEVGAHLDKMGWHSSETALVYLATAASPRTAWGRGGRRLPVHHGGLHFEPSCWPRSASASPTSLAIALRYAQEREQFGRPITEFQAVRDKLARMATQVQAARHLVQRMRGAGRRRRGRCSASMAKYLCRETVAASPTTPSASWGAPATCATTPPSAFHRDAACSASAVAPPRCS